MTASDSHPKAPSGLPVVGWREWVALPTLQVPWVKAKIDTGARTSALHAYAMERLHRAGKPWVRFVIHPMQRSVQESIVCAAEVVDEREIRSSTGHADHRPVILTDLEIRGVRYEIEVTLAARDAMGFRMLLGRRALRGRFVVEPGRAFLGGRPAHLRKKRRKKPPEPRA